MDCVPDAAWVLACGCDPSFEHCEQCDARRKVRTFAFKVQRLHDNEQSSKALRQDLCALVPDEKKGVQS